MIGTSQNRVRARDLNSCSMIRTKTIRLRWTSVPSRATRRAQHVEHCSREAQMHKREASRQSSLRAAMSEQLERLIENLALPVPELSNLRWGRGFFVSTHKNFAIKTTRKRLVTQIPQTKLGRFVIGFRRLCNLPICGWIRNANHCGQISRTEAKEPAVAANQTHI